MSTGQGQPTTTCRAQQTSSAIQLFENHIRAVVNRRNTINGLQYKNDPTIFAWDLINELRDGCDQSAPNVTCTPAFTGTVQVCCTALVMRSPPTLHIYAE